MANQDQQNQSLMIPKESLPAGDWQGSDSITLSLHDRQLVRLSMLHYLLPLGCLLMATLTAEMLRLGMNGSELWSAGAAGLGLFAGLALVQHLAGRMGHYPVTVALSADHDSAHSTERRNY